jgi:hypothetical protein
MEPEAVKRDVAASPLKSSPSWLAACSNSSCVEVARAGETVLVRDGKAPDGPVLTYSVTEWNVFLSAAKDGRFDQLGR